MRFQDSPSDKLVVLLAAIFGISFLAVSQLERYNLPIISDNFNWGLGMTLAGGLMVTFLIALYKSTIGKKELSRAVTEFEPLLSNVLRYSGTHRDSFFMVRVKKILLALADHPAYQCYPDEVLVGLAGALADFETKEDSVGMAIFLVPQGFSSSDADKKLEKRTEEDKSRAISNFAAWLVSVTATPKTSPLFFWQPRCQHFTLEDAKERLRSIWGPTRELLSKY